MTRPTHKSDAPSGTRRYLMHLSCLAESSTGTIRYRMRLQLWTGRSSVRRAEVQECTFEDEYELAQSINPLLPEGSDVRNVLSHIESPDGFLYLLHLNAEQARRLGCRK